MSQPVISVIIPAYNEEDYIRKTLHSLQNQTYQNFETIVVANGCTDATTEIVRKRESDKLKLLTLPNPHVSLARNAGSQIAQGNILLFLDADTTLDTDALHKIITQTTKHIEKNTHIYGTTKTAGDTAELKFKPLLKLKNFYLKTGLHKGSSGAFYCSKELFQKHNGYKEELKTAEHHDLIQRIKADGKYIFTNTTATTSLRRYRKWGVTKIAGFWLTRYFKKSKTNHNYEHIK